VIPSNPDDVAHPHQHTHTPTHMHIRTHVLALSSPLGHLQAQALHPPRGVISNALQVKNCVHGSQHTSTVNGRPVVGVVLSLCESKSNRRTWMGLGHPVHSPLSPQPHTTCHTTHTCSNVKTNSKKFSPHTLSLGTRKRKGGETESEVCSVRNIQRGAHRRALCASLLTWCARPQQRHAGHHPITRVAGWLWCVWAHAEQNRTVFLWQKGLIQFMHDSETGAWPATRLPCASRADACVASSVLLHD
jgi:hypothetical protein